MILMVSRKAEKEGKEQLRRLSFDQRHFTGKKKGSKGFVSRMFFTEGRRISQRATEKSGMEVSMFGTRFAVE